MEMYTKEIYVDQVCSVFVPFTMLMQLHLTLREAGKSNLAVHLGIREDGFEA